MADSRKSTSLSAKTDLHVFHFRNPMPLGGDLDAVFPGREIVDWAKRFGMFDRFVLGNHPPTFFRIRTKLSSGEYLDAMASMVRRLRARFVSEVEGKSSLPADKRLFSGIECDVYLPKPGEYSFKPGEKLLSRYNPDVPLIGFHFHDSLTYAKRYAIDIRDLVGALKWAIDSRMFVAAVHPFDVLGRIYNEDKKGFERIANLARDKKFAFEINADKGFHKDTFAALAENGNLFTFGGDFHALSYWLKREAAGLNIAKEDKALVERVLGITREAVDKEKRYWAKLDPLFWSLSDWGEEGRALREYATHLYRRRRTKRSFERGLKKVLARFKPKQRVAVERYLCELYKVHAKWGGVPRKRERMKVERKYLLRAPLTSDEYGIYERWIGRAFKLGMKKEQLVNTWDTQALERFLKR